MRAAILLAFVCLLAATSADFTNKQERVILRLALRIRQAAQMLEECRARQSATTVGTTAAGYVEESTEYSFEVDSGSESGSMESREVSLEEFRNVRAVMKEFKRDRSQKRFRKLVQRMQRQLQEVREELRECLDD